jgi:exopolysaccharide biosynthesis protein
LRNYYNSSPIPHSSFLIPHFILLIVLCSLLILSCTTFSHVERPVASPEQVSPQWTSLQAHGLFYFAGKVSRPRIEFHALRVDLTASNLRIVVSPGGSYGGKTVSIKVSSFVRDNGLLAGINALPFDTVSGIEGEPRINVGLVIADGVMLSPPHKSFDALVFYKDGRAAIMAQSEISDIENVENAVGGFYRILEHGELAPRVLSLKERHPRSAAGISSDNRFLYLIVIDGRQIKSIGGTEAETALLLRALGASEGINFDGGGSSAMALRGPGGKVRVVNTPIHDQIPGRERAVAGCLGIMSNEE